MIALIHEKTRDPKPTLDLLMNHYDKYAGKHETVNFSEDHQITFIILGVS